MRSPRATSRLAIAGLLVAVTGVLGWLFFVFGADRTGMVRLNLEEVYSNGALRLEVAYRVDGEARSTYEEVSSLGPEAWRPVVRGELSDAPQGAAIWWRLSWLNESDAEIRGVLTNADYYFVDRVEAWWQEPSARSSEGETGSVWHHSISGEAVPAAERALSGRDTALPIVLPARSDRIVYIRMHDLFAAHFVMSWWPEERAFHTAQARGWLAEGIYFGGLLALLSYNTILWVRLRLADFGSYVLYLGTVALFILLARAHLATFGWTLGSPMLEALLMAVMALSGVFLVQFARAFLDLKSRSSWANALTLRLQGVLLVLVAGASTVLWLNTNFWLALTMAGMGATHVVLFGLGVWAWRQGMRQARFFVLSFGCLFAGSLPAVVVWFGPQTQLKDLTMMGLMIGSALEMLLLSLALADRFALAQREAIVAQQKLVEETEHRRAMQEAYADELEAEVRERTHELEVANADKDRMLAVIGHDLRSPLAGLMQAADQASGVFARDTARTGRALLLLIEDLVLWARLRAGTRVVSTHQARALLAPAVALHYALAERGGTELSVTVDDGLRVETDLVLAQTLVRNLLANALKFARTRVVLRAVEEAEGVRFTVGNDGPALPDAVAARLAAGENEPMTATGGLGLRLCREICRALGTRLEARSGAEGGTEFFFVLNAAVDPVESHE